MESLTCPICGSSMDYIGCDPEGHDHYVCPDCLLWVHWKTTANIPLDMKKGDNL